VRFNERIRISGKLIEDDALMALIDEVEAINADQPITFFEITTAMAFHAFATHPADAVLLETGLGGILDATNVLPRVAASVITRISYDHTHILGTTIRAIAGEKSGIIKPGCPVILSAQREMEANEIMRRTAERLDAPLFAYGEDWHIERSETGCRYRDAQGAMDLPPPGLLGAHQYQNAGAAIAALRHGRVFDLTERDFAEGLRTVEWPGRLQRLTRGPLAALLPAHWELWLDGGHNDSGGEVLAEQAASWADKPLFMVYGMLNTKHPADFLRPLATHIRACRTVTIPDAELSLPADEICGMACDAGLAAEPAASPLQAVSALCGLVDTPSRILICGSLYLAGAILADNG
jgi:dihydrofolate synthase/folylpolyglutamate synthase